MVVNSKTGQLVEDILMSKHPDPMQLVMEAFHQCTKIPKLIDIDIMVDII